MSHYCGIDLHSNNHVLVVIDEEDKRLYEKRLDNDLSLTLKALSPYWETLHGIALESTSIGTGWSMDCKNTDMIYSWSTPLQSRNTMA